MNRVFSIPITRAIVERARKRGPIITVETQSKRDLYERGETGKNLGKT